MNRTRYATQFKILLVDVGMLFLSLFLTLVSRYGKMPTAAYYLMHVRYFVPIFASWIIIFYTTGLYSLDAAFDSLGTFNRFFAGIAIGTLLAAMVFYFSLKARIEPRTVLAINAVYSLALLWGWRSVFGAIARHFMPGTTVAFVGYDEAAGELLGALCSRFQLGYTPALLLDESGIAPSDLQIQVTKDRELFLRQVVERDLDLIVISDEKDLPDATRAALVGLIQRHVRFERLDRFYELILRRIPIGMITDLWFLENIDLKGRLPYRVIKRALDLAISFVGLVCSLPFWLFIAAGIKLGSPGPVLYTQVRLGFLGKPFRIVKFRTMRMDGNDSSPTASSDPRITAFGNFLRKTRIDEIPQFLNILRGEMSLVGPRPERPELVAQLEDEVPFYRQRLLAKPGVTGWDQVSGEYHSPSVADTYKKLQYDLYYVKNVSVILDISIFFKTIMTVLGRSGR